MKKINKYLSISPNKIKNSKFPLEVDKDVIINFLKNHGFKEIKEDNATYNQIYASIKKHKNSLVYILGDYDVNKSASYWIRFAKGGKISKENPLFFIRTNMHGYAEDYGDNTFPIHTFNSIEEFAERVNTFFNW